MPGYFTMSFGGVVLDALSLDDQGGRELLILEPSSGTGGKLLDRGPRTRQARVRIEFVQRLGESPEDPLDRRRAFEELADGESRLFSHPIYGTWPAKASIDNGSLDPANNSIEVTFIEDRDSDLNPVAPGPGRLPRAGADTVAVSAERADAALSAIGESSTVATSSVALAESWDEVGETSARQVYTDLNARTAAIDAEIARLKADTRLDRYAVYVSLLEVSSELARAAEAATASTSSTTTVRTDSTTNLIAFCSATYGAANALDRYNQVRALNRLDTPMSIPAGTLLVIPVATA